MVQYTSRKSSQFGNFIYIYGIIFQNVNQADITITDVPNFKMLVYIDLIPL